jgi:hypothetical protein
MPYSLSICGRLEEAGHLGLEPRIAGFGDRCLSQFGQCPRGKIVAAGVRAEGLEPPRAEAHQDLNLARLPNSATPAWLGPDGP